MLELGYVLEFDKLVWILLIEDGTDPDDDFELVLW